jgi:hypothetical protein
VFVILSFHMTSAVRSDVFNNRLLGYFSDRITGYSDDFFVEGKNWETVRHVDNGR